jgi:hypothetical protein
MSHGEKGPRPALIFEQQLGRTPFSTKHFLIQALLIAALECSLKRLFLKRFLTFTTPEAEKSNKRVPRPHRLLVGHLFRRNLPGHEWTVKSQIQRNVIN